MDLSSEDETIANKHASNNRAPKYMKENLSELKEET